MSKLKVSQDAVEVLGTYVGTLKISQYMVEVLQAMPGTLPVAGTVSGVALRVPGQTGPTLSNSGAANILATFRTGEGALSTCTVHISSAFSAGQNIGIIALDGSYNQNVAATTGDKAFTSLPANTTFHVYSYNGGTYHSGMTGAGTFDYVGFPEPVGMAVSQHAVEVLLKDPSKLKVSHHVVEVLVTDTVPAVAAAGGATAHVSIT